MVIIFIYYIYSNKNEVNTMRTLVILLTSFLIFISSAQAKELESLRNEVSIEMNSAVKYIKNLFTDAKEDVDDSMDSSKDNKARAKQLYDKSQEEETNPTVLDHAKKSIGTCNYDKENLKWTGSKWDCVEAQAGQDCQAAPDEYRYQLENGDWVCTKHPKGGKINYYYQFRGYGSKCTGAYSGYEKLYDCVYRNKVGQVIEVSSSYCSGKSKPSAANKLCARQWSVGSWGSCSVTCGGGTMYRSVYCQSGYDCSMYSKPSSSAGCNYQECEPVAPPPPPPPPPPPTEPDKTYSWRTGAWGTCSSSCNGTQTRNVRCAETSNPSLPTVSDGYCSGTKPKASQTCGTDCGTVGPWTVGEWGSCSVTACGKTGVQKRSVTCAYTTCTGSKPADQKSCSTPACMCTYTDTVSVQYSCPKPSSCWSKLSNHKYPGSYGHCTTKVCCMYACSNGHAPMPSNASSSCPSGYSRSGDKCTKTYQAPCK
jgi:hypothetical protein